MTAQGLGGRESASLVGFGVSTANSKIFGNDTGGEGASTLHFRLAGANRKCVPGTAGDVEGSNDVIKSGQSRGTDSL